MDSVTVVGTDSQWDTQKVVSTAVRLARSKVAASAAEMDTETVGRWACYLVGSLAAPRDSVKAAATVGWTDEHWAIPTAAWLVDSMASS